MIPCSTKNDSHCRPHNPPNASDFHSTAGNPPVCNSNTFRCAFQNINGKFASSSQKLFTLQTLLDLDQFHPDIIGLTEPNVNWTSKQCQNLKTTVNYSWPHHHSVATNCPTDPAFPVCSPHSKGGMVQITHGKHSGRISSFHADPLG